MSKRRTHGPSAEKQGWNQFQAEAAYAQSIFQFSLKKVKDGISALERSLEALPTYAPAILSMGSVDYQRGKRSEGRKRFLSLVELPDGTPDLHECLDRAGDFLTRSRAYKAGLELYRRAAARFPKVAVFHQGVGCCAGHQGRHREAVAASQDAVALEPKNQKFMNDLGWSLCQAGQGEKALRVLERAVAMNPKDGLATENLRICRARVDRNRRRGKESTGASVGVGRIRRSEK